MRTRTTQPSPHLSALARILDAACHASHRDALVLLGAVPGDADRFELAVRPLDPRRHPCEELHGFAAPPACWAVALVVHGRAHVLDGLDGPPQPVVSTYLRHRDGREVSLLRRGDRVTEQRGPVEGRLPDLCRRILDGPGSGTTAGP